MMIINYHPNPLRTTVDLDDDDRQRLRLKLIIEELEERIYGAHFHLEPGDSFDPVEALKELDVDSLESESFDKRIDKLLNHYTEELQGIHCGDCTCVPCSCSKCHAEHLLGIDTTKGLHKHPAHYINSAYCDGRETLDEALEHLANYIPVRSGDWLAFPQEEFDR